MLSVSEHYDRASIEEDYAKRLGQLAEKSLGREEVGYVFCFYIFPILYTPGSYDLTYMKPP